ncbi:hypothetical protein BKP35_04260 [Anaerobacillus arseniciselenatis]|uniref:Uncharacterized protein n=1 Tax=Anaerobacillus arseniciselenatis TaxID=85682 RepID=A0A1S2LUJ5_9BACI|nr:hypothetical protein [Anaerobacillus arseniciselenatis]OIJ16198.1 hypothetical protein BKP35_04260 [Anaerobacillus arseniciselenatis]
MSKENELKKAIIDFEELIETTPDEKSSLAGYNNFLRGFLRIRDAKYSLPSAEVMTIIKSKKPTIFYFLKKLAAQNPTLQILTELEIDYNKAVERLEDLKKKL